MESQSPLPASVPPIDQKSDSSELPNSIADGTQGRVIATLSATAFLLGNIMLNQGCRSIPTCNSDTRIEAKVDILGKLWSLIKKEKSPELLPYKVNTFLRALLGNKYKLEDTGNTFAIVQVSSEGERCEVPIGKIAAQLEPGFLKTLHTLVTQKNVKIFRDHLFKYTPPQTSVHEGNTQVMNATNCGSRLMRVTTAGVRGNITNWRRFKDFLKKQKRSMFYSKAERAYTCKDLKKAKPCLTKPEQQSAQEIIQYECHK